MRARIYQDAPTSGAGSSGPTAWGDIANKPTLYSPFCVWAEEGSDLETGFEWSYGNANETPNGMGIVLPFDCELFAIGLTLEGNASCTVEVRRNLDASGQSVSTVNEKQALNNFEGSPVPFSAGDIVNFKTVTGSAASNSGLVVAWFRRAIL